MPNAPLRSLLLRPVLVGAVGERAIVFSRTDFGVLNSLMIAEFVGPPAFRFPRWWPKGALLLLFVSALLTRYRWEVGPVSIRIEQVVIVGILILEGVRLFLTRSKPRLPLPAVLLGGWLAVNALAAVLSPHRGLALQNTLRLTVMAAGFVLVLNLIANVPCWRWAVMLLLLAGVAEAGFGIVARLVYPAVNLGVQLGRGFPEPIPYGTFEEGNLFGSHVASWALLTLALFWAPGFQGRRGLLAAALVVLGTALILSLSRAAWLAFIAGSSVTWVLRHRSVNQQRRNLAALMIGLPLISLLLVGSALFLPETMPVVARLRSFLSLGADANVAARLADWSLAIDDWLQRPFWGWGPGSFVALHGYMRNKPAWISNLTLRLLQEGGLAGLGLFVAFTITLLASALTLSRRLAESRDRALLVGLLAGLAVLWGVAYQSTDGIWLAASWLHAGLLAAGVRVLASQEAQIGASNLSLA